MLTRLRLLRGAAVLLYIGPLFGGLSGLGWGSVAPFVGIFVVWLMVLRPEQWPSSPAEWLSGQAIGAALTQVLSQVLLVLVLLGIGRGLGAVAGYIPATGPLFPLAISFMAIPLCRILWDSGQAAEMGIFLDDEAESAHAPRAVTQAASAVVPLLNLADDADDKTVAAAVAKAMDTPHAALRVKALVAALAMASRSHAALRRALVLWATEPEVVAPNSVPHGMASAFDIACCSSDLLRLYLPRALALIAAFPERAAGFPSPQALRAAAQDPGKDGAQDLPADLRDDLRQGLLALASAVETALAARAA